MTARSCLSAIALSVGVGLLLLVVAFFGFVGLKQSQVADAKAWCERVAVDLEAWRASHGRYPETLEEAGLGKDPPSLCESGLLYGTRGDGFVLDFSEFLIVGWQYDSKRRAWTRYD